MLKHTINNNQRLHGKLTTKFHRVYDNLHFINLLFTHIINFSLTLSHLS